MKKLQDTGLLKIFLPELSNLDDKSNVEGFHHKNNFLHTVQVVDQTREVTNDIVTLWAAVLHDVGKAPSKRLGPNGWTFHDHENVSAKMANAIMLRLKMPVQEWGNKITAICKLHGRLKALTVDFDPASDVKISESAIRRLAYEAGDNLDDLLLFVKCDITTKNEAKKLEYQKNYDLLKVRILNLAEKDSLRNFKLAISGEDIMAAFNLKPSKVVGDIKDEIKNAVLDGAIANEKEAGTKLMYEIASKYNL